MKSISIKSVLKLSAIAFGLMTIQSAQAQVILTGSTYSQNFDSLGTTGTAAPTGWSVYAETGSHFTFAPSNAPTISGDPAPGTNPSPNAAALTAETTLTVANIASATSGVKSAGGLNIASTSTPSDRALGSSPTGTAATVIEFGLTNSTGAAINTLNLSYDTDRFTTTVDNNFGTGQSTATDPYYGVEEFPGYWLYYSLNGGTSWSNVSALNPTLNGSTGVVVPNTVGVTSITGYQLSLSSALNTGSTIEFAWVDDNAESPSPDQNIGLNNVVISTVAAPEPSSMALFAMGVVLALFVGMRRQSRSKQ